VKPWRIHQVSELDFTHEHDADGAGALSVSDVPHADDVLVRLALCARAQIATDVPVRVIEWKRLIALDHDVPGKGHASRSEPVGRLAVIFEPFDDPQKSSETPVIRPVAVTAKLRHVCDSITDLESRRKGATATQGCDRGHRCFQIGFAPAGSVHVWSQAETFNRGSTICRPTQWTVGRQERSIPRTRHDLMGRVDSYSIRQK
jgi:hypothetical protein